MLTNSVGASSPVGCIVAREPEAAGDSVLPSGTNGLQARQEARDFRRGVRRLVPCQKECASEKVSLSSDGRKSKRVTGLSSEAAGLRSEFFKPSGKPSTSRISLLRQGKAQSALSFITLAFSSPEVSSTSFPTPLTRASGKARLLPTFHSGRRLAQRNRYAPCYAGPGCSRDFGASVAAA